MIQLIIFSIIQCSLTLNATFRQQNETLIALEYQSLHYFDHLKNSTNKVFFYFKSSKNIFISYLQ
jgi:hypothetical protein